MQRSNYLDHQSQRKGTECWECFSFWKCLLMWIFFIIKYKKELKSFRSHLVYLTSPFVTATLFTSLRLSWILAVRPNMIISTDVPNICIQQSKTAMKTVISHCENVPLQMSHGKSLKLCNNNSRLTAKSVQAALCMVYGERASYILIKGTNGNFLE